MSGPPDAALAASGGWPDPATAVVRAGGGPPGPRLCSGSCRSR
ncbi:hypothetical protein BJ989_003135 [Nocardioides perillae]|uniref:Uncharacterized protein n=1 Tax=Nocardioides perillae TaxID=1119534 RepID=A0A7Y9UNT7_9ACTN|nr:hypothetical protein [Nocardioides perillae]